MSPEDYRILQERVNSHREKHAGSLVSAVGDPVLVEKKVAKLAFPKEDKGSANKKAMEEAIKKLYPRYKQDYFKEFCFADNRKFRFDFYIPELKLGIEYDGLFSEKSRHTTCTGFTKDCEKINLATILGFKTLRYTSLNHTSVGKDLWTLKYGVNGE